MTASTTRARKIFEPIRYYGYLRLRRLRKSPQLNRLHAQRIQVPRRGVGQISQPLLPARQILQPAHGTADVERSTERSRLVGGWPRCRRTDVRSSSASGCPGGGSPSLWDGRSITESGCPISPEGRCGRGKLSFSHERDASLPMPRGLVHYQQTGNFHFLARTSQCAASRPPISHVLRLTSISSLFLTRSKFGQISLNTHRCAASRGAF